VVPPHAEHPDAPEMIIRPHKGWIGIDWRELWRFRELMFFLVWRDVKVRYKQAALGFAWAIFVPLIMVTIYTLIFGRAGGMKGYIPENLPYPLFIFAGVIPWLMISAGIATGGMSLVNQQNLLNKIYLPRLFIPASVVGGGLVDMTISFTVFSVMMLVYGIAPQWTIVFLPLLILLNVILTLGIAYTLSALTVTYRDFRFLIPFMTQIWMWVSFVAFPIPEAIEQSTKWQWLLALNPMYGIIAAYRRFVLNETLGWHWMYLASSVVISVTLFVFGLFFFRRTERRFADIA